MTRPAIHPGEILADELEELGILQTRSWLVKSTYRQIGFRRLSTASAQSRATRPCASAIGSARPPNSGSTCRQPMTFAWRKRQPARRSRPFPSGPKESRSPGSPALCDHRIQELERQARGAEEAMADDYLYHILKRERASRIAAPQHRKICTYRNRPIVHEARLRLFLEHLSRPL